MSDARSEKLKIWGRLARLPNLFSVAGDPISGGLLVLFVSSEGAELATSALIAAAVASTALYLGGLFLNDYFDRAEDLRERPGRPIPSGAVAPGMVALAGAVSILIGLAVAWVGGGWIALAAAGLVALFVTAYDAGGKRIAGVGPALMACCRAGSVLLGAMTQLAASSAEWSDLSLAVVAAGVAWLYIFFVTVIAARETSGVAPRGPLPYLPAMAIAGGGLIGLAFIEQVPPLYIGASFVVISAWIAWEGRRAALGEVPVPAFIGLLIRKVILIQGVWVIWALSGHAVVGQLLVGAVTLVLYVFAGIAARRFYAS